MNVDKYLSRIHYKGSTKPSSTLLKELHHKHIEYIPFENINNYLGMPVSLQYDCLYKKIIGADRGGYCYELNGLFHQLLLTLGFRAHLLAAQLYEDDILLEHSLHAVIHVTLENQDWLLDVGYGCDGQLYPLIIKDHEQSQPDRLYQLSEAANTIIFSRFRAQLGWQKIMKINFKPVDLSFFHSRNCYHQENNESVFKRNLLCSVYSEKFSRSIQNTLYSIRNGAEKKIHHINHKNVFLNIFKRDFGITISNDMAHRLINFP